MFALLLYCVFCKIVKFDILYEKVENTNSLKLAEFLITKVLDEYNAKFAEIDIQFKLESFYTYNLYSTIPEYKEFSKLAGSRDLKKKSLSLDKIQTNLIVLFSSQRNEDTSTVNTASFCTGRYFINLKEAEVNDGMIRISIEAIRRWIGFVLKTKIPEIYGLNSISLKNSIDEEVIYDAFNCPIYHKLNKNKDNDTGVLMISSRPKLSDHVSKIRKDLAYKPSIANKYEQDNIRNLMTMNSFKQSGNKVNNGYRDSKINVKTSSNPDSSVVISHSEDTLLKKFVFPNSNTIIDDQ